MADHNAKSARPVGRCINCFHDFTQGPCGGCGAVEFEPDAPLADKAVVCHSIVVKRERTTGHVNSVRFVCHGDDLAKCHHWPSCECETWGDADHHGHYGTTPAPGHEVVQQDSCWIDPWFNDALSDVQDWLDAYEDERPGPTYNEDDEDTLAWLVSGDITTTFEGEWMTWAYSPPPGASQ